MADALQAEFDLLKKEQQQLTAGHRPSETADLIRINPNPKREGVSEGRTVPRLRFELR